MMRKIVDRSTTKRAFRSALAALALCAILFQSFFAASAVAADFDADSAAICSTNGQRTGSSDSQNRHDSACCILGCAAFGGAYISTASPSSFLLFRPAQPLSWRLTRSASGRVSPGLHFAARGPPFLIRPLPPRGSR